MVGSDDAIPTEHAPRIPRPFFRASDSGSELSDVMCLACGRVFPIGTRYIMIYGETLGLCYKDETCRGFGALTFNYDANAGSEYLSQCQHVERIVKQQENRPVPQETRMRIFARDGWRCLRCGSKKNLSVDHIKPRLRGRDDSDDNLQTLCKRCNSWKGTRVISFRSSEASPQ